MDLKHKIDLAVEYAKDDCIDGGEEWLTLGDMANALGMSRIALNKKIKDGDLSLDDFRKMEQYLGDGFHFEMMITLPDGTKI